MDAIIALHILQALVELKLRRQAHRESRHTEPNQESLHSPIEFTSQPVHNWFRVENRSDTLQSLCQGVTDVTFKNKSSTKSHLPSTDSPLEATNAHCSHRSQPYHNCQLLTPDGQLLADMHRKKLNWSVEGRFGSKWIYMYTILYTLGIIPVVTILYFKQTRNV